MIPVNFFKEYTLKMFSSKVIKKKSIWKVKFP